MPIRTMPRVKMTQRMFKNSLSSNGSNRSFHGNSASYLVIHCTQNNERLISQSGFEAARVAIKFPGSREIGRCSPASIRPQSGLVTAETPASRYAVPREDARAKKTVRRLRRAALNRPRASVHRAGVFPDFPEGRGHSLSPAFRFDYRPAAPRPRGTVHRTNRR